MKTKRPKKLKTSRFDVTDYLQTPEDCAGYLEACMDEAPGDVAFLAEALGDVARARGMARIAKEAGSRSTAPSPRRGIRNSTPFFASRSRSA